jgi:hypothetical protein
MKCKLLIKRVKALDMNEFVSHHDSSLQLIIEKEFPDKRCVRGKYSAEEHTIILYK